MKLSDYVIDFLTRQGIDTVFGLTGGAAVHFFDSADKHPDMKPVFCHHEQAASLAAPAYAKIKNSLGAAIVTTGPGGTNAVTGVTGAWQDSIPCIYISGQARLEHTSRGKPVRQVGSQELDIISIIESVTKYAEMITKPESIRYHLEKAVYLSQKGRPGPVWLDIPLNLQWFDVNPNTMQSFNASDEFSVNDNSKEFAAQVKQCMGLLEKAQRPLILSGYGIRLSRAEKDFKTLLEKWSIPFVSSWAACDLVATDHTLYVGRIGIAGQRGGNLAVQNCDLLLAIGSHLSVPLTGTRFDYFARDAVRIVVDIDHNELTNETVKVDLGIQADARSFILEILKSDIESQDEIAIWKDKCRQYAMYNEIPAEWSQCQGPVNQYVFLDTLSQNLVEADIIVVDGGGTAVYTSYQTIKIKSGQRIIYSGGIGAMGTGLPESVGACFAANMARTICLCGDGSMQLNIQELQTIVHHDLPVKIFVFNNQGYVSIRQTQEGFLNSNFVGSSKDGGMSLPDFKKVADAYGLKVFQIKNKDELKQQLISILNTDGPVFCEVMISPNQDVVPRQGFKENSDGTYSPRPLEDMYPYLDRDEFFENMIVKPLDVSLADDS